MPVVAPNCSPLYASVAAISSSGVLPARSPMPARVAWTSFAPAWTPARALASDSPRSSWQCVASVTSSGSQERTIAHRSPYSCGVAQPVVSARITVLTPASSASVTSASIRSFSPRLASSTPKEMSCAPREWAYRIASPVSLTASWRVMPRLYFRCRSLPVPQICTWWFGRVPPACMDSRTSSREARLNVANRVVGASASAMRRVASKSSGEEPGKPASMVSAPYASASSASIFFCSVVIAFPGACSPSRKVASKMEILRRRWLSCCVIDPAPFPVRPKLEFRTSGGPRSARSRVLRSSGRPCSPPPRTAPA